MNEVQAKQGGKEAKMVIYSGLPAFDCNIAILNLTSEIPLLTPCGKHHTGFINNSTYIQIRINQRTNERGLRHNTQWEVPKAPAVPGCFTLFFSQHPLVVKEMFSHPNLIYCYVHSHTWVLKSQKKTKKHLSSIETSAYTQVYLYNPVRWIRQGRLWTVWKSG